MKNILCVLPVEQRHKDKLEAAAAGCPIIYSSPDKVSDEQIAAANVILGCVDAKRVKASENLELFQLNTAGTDPYIVPGVLHEKTVLCNATGAYSKAVAEHALASLFMLQKKLHRYRDAQRQNTWTDFGTVSSITDYTVLVVGLGDIGCHFARLVKALGARVIGVKRRPSAKPDCVDELYTQDKLEELLPRADVVFNILPGTGGTHHLYTEEYFKAMKDTAFFINCGRGGAVASEVLYKAVSEKMIAAAAVDVTEIEPLPADSPLWQLDDLVITPHVSGYYHLPHTFECIVDIAAENLRHYFAGESFRNEVDFATGYKK